MLQGSLLTAGDFALDTSAPTERVQLDATSWIDVTRDLVHGADELCAELARTLDWRQPVRRMYDRMLPDPRLSRWYRSGDDPHPHLAVVRTHLERRYRRRLRGVGLNYYRDGRDSVASHSDRELRDVDDTLVAILTLGARRPFLVRPLGGGRSIDLAPGSGDLVVMGGRCQADWEHGVPKVAACGPRISASWRWCR